MGPKWSLRRRRGAKMSRTVLHCSRDPETKDLPREVNSLQLLRRLSSSVRQQQYHGADIITVQVKEGMTGAAG